MATLAPSFYFNFHVNKESEAQPQSALSQAQLLQLTQKPAPQSKPKFTLLADQLNNCRSLITGASIASSSSLQAKIYHFALTKLMPKPQAIAPSITPDLAKQIVSQTLQHLTQDNGQAFNELIHLTGATLWQHIYKRHVYYVNKQEAKPPKLQIDLNDDIDAKTSWFIATKADGADVLAQIKQYVATASEMPQQWLISYQVKDGLLRLKLQLQIDNLPFYYNNQLQTQGYLNICIQKVWLGDHWSSNLVPATIFLSTRLVTQQRIFNTEQPNNILQQKYRKLEQCLTALTPTKAPKMLMVNPEQSSKIQDDDQSLLPEIEPCFINAEGVYKGTLKHGKKHGKGVMHYANGDVYDGDWQDDKRNGIGVMTCKDGHVYPGQSHDI